MWLEALILTSSLWQPENFAPAADAGIVWEAEQTVEKCRRGDWGFNPACCCTHDYCHPVPCEAFRAEGGRMVYDNSIGRHPGLAPDFVRQLSPGQYEASPDGTCHVCGRSVWLRCALVPSAGS